MSDSPVKPMRMLHRKRNFKDLKLDASSTSTSPSGSSSNLLTGTANAGNTNKVADSTSPLASQISKLALSASQGSDGHKMSLEPSEFQELSELGYGNGGTVKKVLHVPTNTIMAKKVIFMEPSALEVSSAGRTRDISEPLKKQILRELSILHSCESEFIVGFHGAFVNDGEISICMEYMDCGSLDNIYRKMGPISETILAQITVAVLEGLVYLYQTHRIIHRDVKPSNILFNSKGQIKICDFGVSGEAINSVSNTFVGTSSYMSPERIQGAKYSVQADVWSLGITLMELAVGKFPFSGEADVTDAGEDDATNEMKGNGRSSKQLAVFELLQVIVHEEVPKLPRIRPNAKPGENEGWSEEFKGFLGKCLIKDPMNRPTPVQLMRHDFVRNAQSRASEVNLKDWAKEMLQT